MIFVMAMFQVHVKIHLRPLIIILVVVVVVVVLQLIWLFSSSDTMDKWDQSKLEEVIEKKHGEKEKSMPKTEIVCCFYAPGP